MSDYVFIAVSYMREHIICIPKTNMKSVISTNCLRAVKPLFWLLVVCCLSCGSLNKLNIDSIETSQPLLQVAIGGNEFSLFMKRIQELNLVPVDVQQRIPNLENVAANEFFVTFRFVTQNVSVL